MGKVLVADESKVIRTICEWLLSAEHTVQVLETGAELLRIAAASPADVIVLDYTLPDQDAYEVCRQLKSNPATARSAVLMLGGSFAAFDAAKATQHGADDSLIKPFKAEDLITKVNHLVAAAAAGQVRSLAAPRPSAPALAPAPSAPAATAPEPGGRFQFPGRGSVPTAGSPKRFSFPGSSAPAAAPQPTPRMASPAPQPAPRMASPAPQPAPHSSPRLADPERGAATPASPLPSVGPAAPMVDEQMLRAEVYNAVRELLPGIVKSILKDLITKEVTPQLQRWVEGKVEQVMRQR
ncbi:MAG: response regulator [Myxococcota bacterium]|jgi:CheY-like chemotaxis protein|nr:response regulator [Myxococcota bacterium]